MPIGMITPISVNTSNTSQIIYIGTPTGGYGILMSFDHNDLKQISNDLINGFISGKYQPGIYYDDHDPYPNIAINSVASFNSKKDNNDLVITEFSTMTQKTIKDAQGYKIVAVMGKYTDNQPITFIGDNWERRKHCIGTIDAQGNSQILQEFNRNENETMTGFLLKLN